MHAISLLGLIAGLALSGAAYAQASMRTDDDKQRKKATLPAPAAPVKPRSTGTENSEYTRPPYRPRTERDYEPWRSNRQSPPPKSPSAPRTPPAKSTAKPAEAREPALARCDDLKRRMEQLVREEGFGGDAARQQQIAEQRRALYQEELRFGCI